MTIKPRIFFATLFLLVLTPLLGADPTATRYSAEECEGTYMPYPAPPLGACAVPDSLEAVFINHVGRHGARYLSSDKNITYLRGVLKEARANRALTPLGEKLSALVERIATFTDGNWGALDSLGAAEQRQIAARMMADFPALLRPSGRDVMVTAISSYSPRCIMSMYQFVHQLSRLNNRLEISTSAGRQNSPLLRPFDSDSAYRAYREDGQWKEPIKLLGDQLLTTTPLDRIFTRDYLPQDLKQFLQAEFAVVASVGALGWPEQLSTFFTPEEQNALWAVDNLTHYLRYSASTLTTSTSEMAAPLLLNLVKTTDAAADGAAEGPLSPTLPAVMLRFGHAETLMPLLALMHLPGCYYMTNYFDTVGLHWRDFHVVPMAANVRLVLLRHKENGRMYVRVDLNERPVPLIPGRQAIYMPWDAAREYLIRCLPLDLQP